MTVILGSPQGPAAAEHVTLTQDSPGVPGSSAPGNHFGAATAWGDVNSDGYADLALGAPGQDDADGHTDRGSVTVLHGPRLNSGLTYTTSAASAGARLGSAVAVADFNGFELDVRGGRTLAIFSRTANLPWSCRETRNFLVLQRCLSRLMARSGAVSASFVVAGAGLVLSSSAPGGPVQDVFCGGGSAVGEAGDPPSYFGEAEVDEIPPCMAGGWRTVVGTWCAGAIKTEPSWPRSAHDCNVAGPAQHRSAAPE